MLRTALLLFDEEPPKNEKTNNPLIALIGKNFIFRVLQQAVV